MRSFRFLAIAVPAFVTSFALCPAGATASTDPAQHAAPALGSVVSGSVPVNYCVGKPANTVVRTYRRGATAYPLRCGTSSWGFNHVTHRWNGAFDAMIAATIARGQSAGPGVLAFYSAACRSPSFKVVFNLGALHGTSVRPQGIITAYAVALPAESAGPRGCPPV